MLNPWKYDLRIMKDEVNLGRENMNMSQLEERNSGRNKLPICNWQRAEC
jgi:hypothetical protein